MHGEELSFLYTVAEGHSVGAARSATPSHHALLQLANVRRVPLPPELRMAEGAVAGRDQWAPLLNPFAHLAKMLHFNGALKPWSGGLPAMCTVNASCVAPCDLLWRGVTRYAWWANTTATGLQTRSRGDGSEDAATAWQPRSRIAGQASKVRRKLLSALRSFVERRLPPTPKRRASPRDIVCLGGVRTRLRGGRRHAAAAGWDVCAAAVERFSCSNNENSPVPCLDGTPCPIHRTPRRDCATLCEEMPACRAFLSNVYNHCYLRPARGEVYADNVSHATLLCTKLSSLPISLPRADDTYCGSPEHVHDGVDELYERFHRGNSSSKVSVAVYTYLLHTMPIVRSNLVPNASGVDAFLYLPDGTSALGDVELWRRSGWAIRHVPLVHATATIAAARLTAKWLKFNPPLELTSKYEWLVTFDHDYYLSLPSLPRFLAAACHRDRAMLLLDWVHYADTNRDPEGPQRSAEWPAFRLMQAEMHAMLDEEDGQKTWKVASSRNASLAWRDMVADWLGVPPAEDRWEPWRVAARGERMPHFFDGSVLMMHVAHPSWPRVREAWDIVLEQSHALERDQWIMPFALWRAGVAVGSSDANATFSASGTPSRSAPVGVVELSTLQRGLGHCRVLPLFPVINVTDVRHRAPS